MQATSTITLPPKCLSLIREHAFARSAQLFKELNEQQEQIKLMLSGYFYVERGRVYDLEIAESSVNVNEKGEAQFTVRFRIGTLDACADLERSIDAEMRIKMKINLETGESLITGENIPEREPDEI